MAIPMLTPEERADALKKAQEMRSKRTLLRKELKSGKVSLTEIFDRVDEDVVGKMKVKYLLESLPNVGKITAAKLMTEIGIKDSRRVQGLGSRQKSMLLKKLA